MDKQRCGFRKGFNAQHSLLKLFEKWRKSSDQGLVFGVLLTELSKAFERFSHEHISLFTQLNYNRMKKKKDKSHAILTL